MLEKICQLYNKEKDLNEASTKNVNQTFKEELAIYDTLRNCLSEKEKALLDKFIDCYVSRHCKNVEQAYKDGFVDGSLLTIEIFSKK